ncbi:MAG: hypothetical protein WCO84_05910 [bacterium]
MKTYYQIKTELLHLRLKIESTNINELPKQKNWGGADIIITGVVTEEHKKWLGFQLSDINSNYSEHGKRLIVTKYHQQLSWLFYQLRDMFSGYLDYMTKYDFYGTLAQGAFIAKNPDSKEILLAVVDSGMEFLEQMNKGEMFDKN